MSDLLLHPCKEKTSLAQFNNDWYKPGPKWKRLLWLPINVLFFNNGLAILNGFKCTLLRMFGAKIGNGVIIKPSVNIKYPWFLEIGNNTWIGEKVWIDNLAPVRLGNNVCLSQGAFLLTGNHNYNSIKFELKIGEILIEDGVWIGAKAIVCPGVICKSHSVLTVASVATKDLEEYYIYRGCPAEKVKKRIFKV